MSVNLSHLQYKLLMQSKNLYTFVCLLQKSDGSVVQVLEGSGRSQQTKSNGGSGKNQICSQRQPRFETEV